MCWVAIPIGTVFQVQIVRLGSNSVAINETVTADNTPSCFVFRTVLADIPRVQLELRATAVRNGQPFTKYQTLEVQLHADHVAGAPPQIESVTTVHSVVYDSEPNVWLEVDYHDLDYNASRVEWRVVDGAQEPRSGGQALFEDSGHGSATFGFRVNCGDSLTVAFSVTDSSGQRSPEQTVRIAGPC